MTAQLTPTIKQFKALEYLSDSKTTELGFGGAAHGGKSFIGCAWVVMECLKYPGIAILLGRKELTNLKRTTLLTLFNVFKTFGITEEMYVYNGQNNIITLSNGSQIFLLDLGNKPSDPLFTRLGGLELTHAFIDESNEVPHQAIDILKTRIGRRKNTEYKILGKLLETFNPDKGHVYQRYYRPYKENTLPEYRKFIQALPTDNPHTPKEYIEQLKRSDKITIERLLLGNFEYDDDPNSLVRYDSLIDLFTNAIPQTSQKYLTADIARYGQDRTVIGIWEGLKLVEIHVFHKEGIDFVSNKIRELVNRQLIPFSHCVIDEDGIGGGVLDLNRGMKGFVANSKPLDVQGKTQNYRNLKTQCGFVLAEMINDHKLAISETQYSQEIVEELEQILKAKSVDTEGKLELRPKDEVKTVLGKSPDLADMILMRVFLELNPVKNKVTVSKPDYNKTFYGNRNQNGAGFSQYRPR